MKMLPWDEVQAVVFDVDGTLYDQRKLRLRIVTEMMVQAARGSFSFADFKTIMLYRRCRERWAESQQPVLATTQYELAASMIGRPASEIRRLVEEWIERRPLPHLRACRFASVDAVFERLRARGIRIGVFSDYPIKDKLVALALRADAVAYALEPEISYLKPNTAVLKTVISRLTIAPKNCLVIGDREDKDGVCAHNLEANFICRHGRRFFQDLLATI